MAPKRKTAGTTGPHTRTVAKLGAFEIEHSSGLFAHASLVLEEVSRPDEITRVGTWQIHAQYPQT
jgi:hypothetical protein